MKTADLVIIGGGMVGLALAALVAPSGCQIKIIEKHLPDFNAELPYRVSALNHASQKMLQKIGVWQSLDPNKYAPYQQMFVWEKDSFAKIQFDIDDPAIRTLGLTQLGFIVENQQLQQQLWHYVSSLPNVEILLNEIATFGISDNGVFLTLANHDMLSAKLVVGADGANSWLRQRANIPLISRDYQHTALVCNVRTAEAHQQTARQIFAPESILAFLPLRDPHHCSIVWSLPPTQAQQLLNCDEKQFNQALTIAFDNQLGLCELQTARAIYPLTARYARNFAQPRLALIGDAAHTIHPLAGLGVNLGFADAQLLATTICQHFSQGHDIGEYRHLRQFERERKVDAVKMLSAMEGLKFIFANDNPLKKLVRGVGLTLTNQNPLLKKALLQQAMGI